MVKGAGRQKRPRQHQSGYRGREPEAMEGLLVVSRQWGRDDWNSHHIHDFVSPTIVLNIFKSLLRTRTELGRVLVRLGRCCAALLTLSIATAPIVCGAAQVAVISINLHSVIPVAHAPKRPQNTHTTTHGMRRRSNVLHTAT